jgi:hypothetical protein
MKESGELDLGIMPDKSKDTCCPSPCNPCEDQPRYPELCFRGKHADLFREKYGACAPGDEFEATFKLRVKVSGDSDSETDDYNKRIEFAVTAVVGDVVEEEPTEPATPAKPTTRKLAKAKSAAPAKASSEEPGESY